MKERLYDSVKKLLEENPKYRDDDKELMWRLWKDNGKVLGTSIAGTYYEVLTKQGFLEFNFPESVRRCRAQIQADYPHLKASEMVQKLRDEKESEKGTFVFRENLK